MADNAPDLMPPSDGYTSPLRARFNELRRKTGRFLRACRNIFPLSWCGLLVFLAGVIGWLTIGSDRLDLVVSSASFILAILVLVLLGFTIINAIRLRYKLKHTPLNNSALKLETGYPRETDFRIPIFYLPFTEITWVWSYPTHIQTETKSDWRGVSERVTAFHHFHADRITRVFIVRDIIGLARIQWSQDFECSVLVLPHQEQFNTNQVLPSVSDGDDTSDPYGAPHGDRIEMRKYTPGDSSRDIIWKIYARTRRLMVRTPERAITAQPRSCAYLIGANGDTVSARLARTILERHMLGDNWGFGADGTPGLITNLGLALQAIARSGNHELIESSQATSTGLAKYMQEAELHGYNNCLVFVPARLTPPPPPLLSRWRKLFEPAQPPWPKWAPAARQATGTQHMTVTWIMGVEEPPETLAKPQPEEKKQLKPWQSKALSFLLHDQSVEEDQSLEVTKALVSEVTPVWIYDSKHQRFLVYNRPADVQAR